MSNAGRKDEHIRINLEEDVGFHRLTTGFERYHFVHQALPEIDLSAVDTSISLFGKRLSAPILVSSMTGGTEQAGLLNRRLAEAAQHKALAMGVGSQRTALEDGASAATFAMRKFAPDALLFANLGAVQLNYGYTVDQCRRGGGQVGGRRLVSAPESLAGGVAAGGRLSLGRAAVQGLKRSAPRSSCRSSPRK